MSNLEKLYNLCKSNNHELFIVIAPARKDYVDNLPDENVLFDKLFKLADKINLNIINLYSGSELLDEDFGDSDHLTPNGAIKFTKILDCRLNK